MRGPTRNRTVQTVQFCTSVGSRSNVSDMSYFIAATQGLSVPSARLCRIERFFRMAESTQIELTDQGYELFVDGEFYSLSFSLEDALDELDTALLGAPGPRSGIPMAVLPEPLSPRVWGVDMEHATRQARYALESL